MWQLSLLTFSVKLVMLLLLDLLQSRSLITNCLPILGNYKFCKKWLRGVFNKTNCQLKFFLFVILLHFIIIIIWQRERKQLLCLNCFQSKGQTNNSGIVTKSKSFKHKIWAQDSGRCNTSAFSLPVSQLLMLMFHNGKYPWLQYHTAH